MKNWWHKLYTIPALKMLLLWFGASLLCDFFAMQFLGSIKVFAAIGYMYPCMYYLLNDKSFESNIDFHKSHVNFPELRQAVFTNNFILSTFALGLFLGGIVLSKQFGVLSTEVTSEWEVVVDFLTVAPAAFLPSQYIFHYKKYNMVDSHDGLKSGILIFLVFASTFSLLLVWIIKFQLPTINYVIVEFIAFFIGNLWFVLRAPFHLEARLNSFKTLFKYQSVGAVISLSIYAVIGGILYFDFNQSSYETKKLAFKYLGRFSPELTLTSFNQLLSIEDVRTRALVFTKAKNVLGQIDIKSFSEKEELQNVYMYLRIHRPTSEQIKFLMGFVDRNKSDWSVEYVNAFEKLLVKKWPKGETVPEHLVKHIEVPNRMPAKQRGP